MCPGGAVVLSLRAMRRTFQRMTFNLRRRGRYHSFLSPVRGPLFTVQELHVRSAATDCDHRSPRRGNQRDHQAAASGTLIHVFQDCPGGALNHQSRRHCRPILRGMRTAFHACIAQHARPVHQEEDAAMRLSHAQEAPAASATPIGPSRLPFCVLLYMQGTQGHFFAYDAQNKKNKKAKRRKNTRFAAAKYAKN